MRKPVFLAVLGFSIIVAAVSLGVILTSFLGLIAYSPKAPAQVAATPAGPAGPAAPPEEWNNLFAPGAGMKLASRLPAVDGMTDPLASRSNFVLMGTIVSSNPVSRRAILWATGMKAPEAFREKEEVEPGAFLASVERDVAWITRGSEREKLEILPLGSHGGTAVTGADSPVGSAALRPASPDTATGYEEGRRLTRQYQLRQNRGNRR
ncbi:hypothetical protein [Candidatus Deferrimicrobium sp.]|uniref:hypothetical protein n=1 Tax=Candidatus Deferrimicrobium sp. TaxID=3060586 RepID=UPI002EDB5FBE